MFATKSEQCLLVVVTRMLRSCVKNCTKIVLAEMLFTGQPARDTAQAAFQ